MNDTAHRTVTTLRVLCLEDDPDEFHLLQAQLNADHIDDIELSWVSSYEEAMRSVIDRGHDAYIVDHLLPGTRSGLDFIRQAQEYGSLAPLVLLTGADEPDLDVRALEAGAWGFMRKDELTAAAVARTLRYSMARAKALERMQAASSRDPLTGLGNRVVLADGFSRALARSVRGDLRGAILFLDLDGFKAVNDTHGHAGGDAVLVEAGRRALELVRATDTVVRVGGDEFVVLVEDVQDDDELEAVVERLGESLARPYPLPGGGEVELRGASIGWAKFPEEGDDLDTLLGLADERMYANKRRRTP